jgi:hypothetical protein
MSVMQQPSAASGSDLSDERYAHPFVFVIRAPANRGQSSGSPEGESEDHAVI